MSNVTLEINKDNNRSADSCLVILLRGQTEVPDESAYSIVPADRGIAENPPANWPYGLHEPVEIRRCDRGIELIIGPDITERLTPGTRVVIEIPSLALRQEAVCPSRLLSHAPANPAPATAGTHVDPAGPPPAAVSLREAQEKLSTIIARITNTEPSTALTQKRAHDLPNVSTDRLSSPVPLPSGTHVGSVGSSADEFCDPFTSRYPDRPRILESKLGARNSEERYSRDSLPSISTGYKHAKPAAPHVDRTSRRMSSAALGLVAIAGVLAAVAASWGSRPATGVSASIAPTQPTIERNLRSKGSLSDIFAVPLTSPSGKTRKDVDLERALTLADEHLQGAGAGARSEGEYWLRHALSMALADERIKWALTQLGSVYAASGFAEAPDYKKARLLWEIAGQLGDPVALCFLGSLDEYGLGVSANKASALSWYARAKQAGGCPKIDEALARVSR